MLLFLGSLCEKAEMKHLQVKQWSRSKEQRLNNRYSESSHVWNEGNLEPQTFVQTKWMRGKAAAFCFQPFWVFTSSASSDDPHDRNTENPKDANVWSCHALDKPTVHAGRQAHYLPAFEGSFYRDIFSDSQKLWNFYLSRIIMKFLDSSFSFSHMSELGKAFLFRLLLQQAWLKSHSPLLPWTVWEGYLGFWHTSGLLRFCSKLVLVSCTAQVRTDSLWTAWL